MVSPPPHSSSSTSECFFNSYVISHVCKFLCTAEIKNCRLVSHNWNYGAIPILKKRTVTNFDLDSNILEIVEKLKFRPFNVFLSAEICPDFDHLPPVNVSPINNLKSIVLRVGEEIGWMLEFCQNIILASSSTLEELTIIWDELFGPDLPSFEGTVFQNLTKFVVRGYAGPTDQTVKTIYPAITNSFTKLSHLELNYYQIIAFAELGLVENFPASINSLVVEGLYDINVVEWLLQFPPTLKRFTMKEASYYCDNRPRLSDAYLDQLSTTLYNLLKKLSPSLEAFEINMEPYHNIKTVMTLTFPVFPVMKSFKIIGNPDTFQAVEFESSPEHFDEIDYKICFPMLEILKISIPERNMFPGESEFFPDGCTVVESVKEVGIDFVSLRNDADKVFAAHLFTRGLEMFPNAKESLVNCMKKVFEC